MVWVSEQRLSSTTVTANVPSNKINARYRNTVDCQAGGITLVSAPVD